MTLGDGVLVAGIGLVSGVIGSLFAPWVHWGIDKRRRRLDSKAEKIREWRTFVDQFDFENDVIGDTATYAAMRPYLLPKIIKEMEQATMYLQVGGPGRGDQLQKQRLSDEITRIERKWELV